MPQRDPELGTHEYPDIMVTIAHPAGEIEAPLSEWITQGPGPRPFVRIVRARRISTGAAVDLSRIPLEYHNSPEARRRQRRGELPCPWGPPPDEP